MAKFPLKTSAELKRYFLGLKLNQLEDLNRSYEPHFNSLGDRIDTIQVSIDRDGARLQRLNHELAQLKLGENDVYLAQVAYERDLSNVRDETGIDRTMGMRSLGVSPLQIYESHSSALFTESAAVSFQLRTYEAQLQDLRTKFTQAVSELKILNQVIDQKRESEQEFVLTPNNSSV